ncbi:MAG: ATP-binding protein [Alphaproteobacteria bacterium]|nr:ATP-binding protein [Alphaproteobacteria bacterium]
MSRIEARTLELRESKVDMGALVRMAAHMNDGLAREAKVEVKIAGPSSLPHFRGDELRLTQVLLNLIGNGLKYTLAGGEVRVGYGLSAAGGIEVTIADTGVGIHSEDIERVQVPFARGDNRSAFVRTKEGLGLGLPLAKAFTEAHGGTLKIASRVGEGTSITLEFPAERIV